MLTYILNMEDIGTIIDIKFFVDEFYNKVRGDKLIGPVFAEKISDWQPHLDKMYSFWNAALFGVPGYKGNPFSKHAPLKIDTVHFTRWLSLFTEVIDQNFKGPIADDVKKRAALMANIFLVKLGQMKNGPGKVIV